jgi:hypothetical protein
VKLTSDVSLNRWAALVGIPASLVSIYVATTGAPQWAYWVALSVLAIAAISPPCLLFWHMYRRAKMPYRDGLDVIAASISYRNDGNHLGTFEMQRFVQVKQPYMRCIPHRFYWYGTQRPTSLTSRLQNIDLRKVKWRSQSDATAVNTAYLELREPRIFDECEVVHFAAQVDIRDPGTPTFVGIRVVEPMQYVELRATLAQPSTSRTRAQISREALDASGEVVEIIEQVAFDHRTSSYEWRRHDPAPGYLYKLDYHTTT